ncbi:hypothetical protein BH11PSE12_BH11PSE12_14560 [soil metagenome]
MNNQIDSSIPVLTEIIHLDTEFPANSQHDVTSAAKHVSESNWEDPQHAPQIGQHDDLQNYQQERQWEQLEQTLRENVLRQVLSRVDFVLEHRVRDSLADVLQTAVESLAIEIRTGLHKTMEEVITRAITQEIAKAKVSK